MNRSVLYPTSYLRVDLAHRLQVLKGRQKLVSEAGDVVGQGESEGEEGDPDHNRPVQYAPLEQSGKNDSSTRQMMHQLLFKRGGGTLRYSYFAVIQFDSQENYIYPSHVKRESRVARSNDSYNHPGQMRPTQL